MSKSKPILTARQIDRMTDLDELNRILIKEAKRINTRISEVEKLPQKGYGVDQRDVQQFAQHFQTPKAGTRKTSGGVIGVKFSEGKAKSAAEARVRLKAISTALSFKESTKRGAAEIVSKTQSRYSAYFGRSVSFSETKDVREMFKELNDRGLLQQVDSDQVMKVYNMNHQSGGALASSSEELVTKYFEDSQLPVADAVDHLQQMGYTFDNEGNLL